MARFEIKQSSKLQLTSYSGLALVGFCAIIREKAKNTGDAKAAYWQEAQAACDETTGLTERTYANMVKQIERAGAPYTGKDTVMSLGSKLFGKGSDFASRSWLWVRDVDAYGDTKGREFGSIQEPTKKNPPAELLYYKGWQPGGDSWRDVEDVIYHSVSKSFDLPTIMRDEAGFKNITDRAIWVDKEFSASFKNLADFHGDEVEDFVFSKFRCFVASGIRSPLQTQTKDAEGIVCSERQLKNFVWRGRWGFTDQFGSWLHEVTTRPDDNNGYGKYESELGSLTGYWKFERGVFSSEWTWRGIWYVPAFMQSPTSWNMIRWPVLDVASLKPTMSLVDKNVERKCTNAVNAPTRCGDDLDRVINDIIPRPVTVSARIPLPEDRKKVTMALDSANLICSNPFFGGDWSYEDFRWEVQDPSGGKMALRSRMPDRVEWLTLLGEVWPLKDTESNVVWVRCGVEGKHGPTGTRYEVTSPWYSFNIKSQTFKELTP